MMTIVEKGGVQPVKRCCGKEQWSRLTADIIM
jgi:hypothetical protein